MEKRKVFCNNCGQTLSANKATENKEKIKKTIQTMWQLEAKLKKDNLLHEGQALAFFCPVYFAGQLIVKQLLDKKDEQGELIMFPLPKITDKKRIEFGLKQMKLLGISNPESLLEDSDKVDWKALPLYSSLPGIEGVGSEQTYDYIATEFVQLGAFQIVPKDWINQGDPINETYKFPGEKGYSPYWRVPPFEELKGIRENLWDNYKETSQGIVRK